MHKAPFRPGLFAAMLSCGAFLALLAFPADSAQSGGNGTGTKLVVVVVFDQFRGDYLQVLGPSAAAGESMRAWGSRYARLIYERCGRNKRRACRQLDISYHTLEAYLSYPHRKAEANRNVPAWVQSASRPQAPEPEAPVRETPQEP